MSQKAFNEISKLWDKLAELEESGEELTPNQNIIVCLIAEYINKPNLPINYIPNYIKDRCKDYEEENNNKNDLKPKQKPKIIEELEKAGCEVILYHDNISSFDDPNYYTKVHYIRDGIKYISQIITDIPFNIATINDICSFIERKGEYPNVLSK